MLIDQLNLNHLRIFECVYRTRSMTAAAKELHLTQSGVSQHMKSLEENLGVRLFDRIQLRLVPTAAAATLFERCSRTLHDLERTLWQIASREAELTGTVTVGFPSEFGNSVGLPLFSKFVRKHPRLRFKVVLGLTNTMNELLLRGEVDFAFVDTFAMDARIQTVPLYAQDIELVTLPELFKKSRPYAHRQAYYESIDYVGYAEEEPIIRMWFDHHLRARKTELRLRVRAVVMDAQALAHLMLGGVGAAVLPGSLVAELRRSGHKLHVYPGSGKPLKNVISVASLRERTQSVAASTLLDWFKHELARLG